MKLLAMIMIDDLGARRFLENFFAKNGPNARLKSLHEAYFERFKHNPSLTLYSPEEWTKKKLDLIYVPIVVEMGRVKLLSDS